MSISRRRTLAQAMLDIEDFQRLVAGPQFVTRWEVAGSVRRKRPDIGDVDVVAIPRFAEIAADDMFGTPTRTNLLWHRVDALLALNTFAKHIKDTKAGPRTKWGERTRAIEFRGTCFEIQIADKDNFGPWLAVKTGPAEMEEELQARVKKYGYQCRDGFHVWDMNATPPN